MERFQNYQANLEMLELHNILALTFQISFKQIQEIVKS